MGRPRTRVLPRYALTASLLLAEPEARVRLECSACDWRREITKDDLAKLVASPKWGPMWSMYGRHPACPSCGKHTSYWASHAVGARFIRLDDEAAKDQIARLHELWAYVRARL